MNFDRVVSLELRKKYEILSFRSLTFVEIETACAGTQVRFAFSRGSIIFDSHFS
jgi:hypothetical protein